MAEPKSSFMAMIGQPVGGPGRANKYDPAHCDTIKQLAQAGKFPETWACEIGVSVETIRLWGHKHPDFREALIIAKHLLGHYWTEQVAKGTTGRLTTANASMFAMIIRRLPALFGNQPVDLTDYVLRPEVPEEAPQSLAPEQIKSAPTDELMSRLDALRRRRDAEGA